MKYFAEFLWKKEISYNKGTLLVKSYKIEIFLIFGITIKLIQTFQKLKYFLEV